MSNKFDDDNLGRLKSTTNTPCNECGKKMQLRVREDNWSVGGFTKTTKETEYLYCPHCGNEMKYKNQKRKRVSDDE